MKTHIINVGPSGTFMESGTIRTTPEDVDRIVDAFKISGKTLLVVHFHGGLVKETAGIAIADRLKPVYEAAGGFPITFVWEAGFMETLSRNLGTIHNTKLFGKLLKYTLKFVAEKIGGVSGKGPGDPVAFDEIEAEIESGRLFTSFDSRTRGDLGGLSEEKLNDLKLELEELISEELDADEEIEAILTDEALNAPLVSPKLQQDAEEARSRGLFIWSAVAKVVAGVVVQVIRRYLKKRDHGLYPTVVEEVLRAAYMADFGEWMWGGMKTAAENMCKSNEGLSGDSLHVGTYFLERLKLMKGQWPDFKVDLIGHSAGAIAICNLLKVNADLNTGITFRNILFLAPACTTTLFHKELVKQIDRFQNFRMYTMRDDFESEDSLLPGIYTRSLLYFISGVLESEVDAPILGMERYLSGKEPYRNDTLLAAREFIVAAGKNRLVLSDSNVIDPSAPKGMQCRSKKHGDFDNDATTLTSLAHVISSA
jgi:hypothetical protein